MIGIVGLLASVAAPATADAATAPASLSVFETTPLARSAVSANATITYARSDGTGPLALGGSGLRAVVDPANGVRVEVVGSETGEVRSALDLTGRLDTVVAITQVNDDDNGGRLVVFLRGTREGAPRLLRVTATGQDSLRGATVDEPTGTAVDPARLVLLDGASSGLLAVHRADDGTYSAQRISYALRPVRSAVTLPLRGAGTRTFAMSPDTGSLFSFREGGVDVVSIYDPATARSTDLPGVGVPARVRVDGARVALADASGNVVLVETDADGAPIVRRSLSLDAAPRALDVKDAFDELVIVTADGHTVRRFPVGEGDERPSRSFDGIRIVEGSLTSGRWYEHASSFIAAAGDATYRYTDAYLLAPVPAEATISSPERVGDPMDWSMSAYASGDVDGVWEYSLDGGAHWAARGATWETAVPDTGDVVAERPALPAPLDGVAPSFRSEQVPVPLAWSTFGQGEYAVSLPSSGYGASWRPRFTSALGSVTGPVQTISLVTPPQSDGAPVITRHPAPAHAVAGTTATFQAAASGDPAPAISWERSSDGTTWTAVAGGSSTTLSLPATLGDSGSRFRAVFTANGLSTTSEAALLTVAPAPAPVVGAAPEGAVSLANVEATFDLNDYGRDWARAVSGPGVRLADRGFVFDGGSGWRDPLTGEFQAVWEGSAIYRPYGGLNGLHLTFTNPYLAIDGEGRGTLTAEVSWNNGGGMGGAQGNKDSGGARRVVVATFTGAAPVADADGTFRFACTPEWADRPYVKPGLGDARTYTHSYPASFLDYLDDDLRGWFLTTGNSRDPEKAPRQITASFAATTVAASREGAVVSATDPLADGAQHFADSAPLITAQPVPVTVAAGGAATFEVAADGIPAPEVTWQQLVGDTWIDIAGATTSVLRVEDVAAGTQTLRARATSRAGSATSDAVTLTGSIPRPEPSTGPGPGEGTATPAPDGAPAAPVAEGSQLDGLPRGGITAAFAGGTLTVSGLAPDAWFHLTAYSSPTPLGWSRSSATGTVALTLPQGIGAGPHRVAVQDASGTLVGWAAFEVTSTSTQAPVSTVSGRQLAVTGGSDPAPGVAWAVLLVLVGGGLLLARRARPQR